MPNEKNSCFLAVFTAPLAAQSFLSEYRGHGYVVIFQGDIKEGDEDEVRSLQTQYLESMIHPHYRNRLHNLSTQLGKFGVKVKTIEDNPYIDSENAVPYFSR